MKRAPFYEQPPTIAEVRAAWRKARPDAVSYQRRASFTQRAFFQGAVAEHLKQEAERASNPKRANLLYRPTTAAEKTAIAVTRAWLEFGDPLEYEAPADEAPTDNDVDEALSRALETR